MSQAINEEELNVTPLYNNEEELGKVLYALTQPNNQDLKRATLLIRKFLDKPEAIMPLVKQIEGSQHPEVRQVAAVYLREQIEEFYKKVPSDIKPKLKAFLINKLVSMTNRAERLAIGAAIASIAKYAFVDPNEGWNELLVSLEKICKPNENVELREVGYILWRNLVSFCGGALKKHFGKILQILQVGLKDDKSIKIQVESVKSIGIMVEFLENEKEVAIIEGFIPSMVGVIDKCLKKGDEENVIAGMEVFNDLVESKVPVLHKHAEQLTKFNLKIAAAKDELPMTVRKQATNFATWMCKSKPKTVIKLNFIQPFLTLCINLVIESNDDDVVPANNNNNNGNEQNNDDDEDEKTAFLSPLGIACDLLDEIFLNIPSEQCFPIATKAIEKLLVEPQANRRKSGYVLIAMMAEGTKEIIGKGDNLKMLLQACLKGMTDEASVVRKCSLEAISQICTHCNFDILQYHKMILPNIFKIFEKQNEEIKVKERALSAIEMFIDAYDPSDDNDNTPNDNNDQFKIVTYLQDIMNVIGKCLETQSQDLQKQAISTLSSCAQASLTNFNIYLPKVMQLLDSLMQLKDTDKIDLRAEATSCLGSVAGAVGLNSFKSFFPKFHGYVMNGLMDIDNSDIREASFMYFSELAEIMGPDILKLQSFEEMLNFILFVIEDDDGLMVELPDDGFRDAIPPNLIKAEDQMAEIEAMEQAQIQELTDEQIQQLMAQAIEAEEENENDPQNEAGDDDDDDEVLRNHVGQLKTIKLNVTTGFMEEKAAAVHALTSFIKNGGFGFLQWMEECWERLTYLWEYPHSLVKMSVAACFHEFFTLIVNHSLDNNPQALPLDDNPPNKDDKNNNESNKNKIMNKKYPWSKGIEIEYNSNVQNWIDTIFPLYIQAIHDEEDRDALNVIIDYFIDELKILGPNSISSLMEELVGAINLYLKEECVCQQSSDPRNIDTKDIGTKHQWISDTIADLIATLAELWGNKFPSIFDKLFSNLLQFGRESRHPQDQAMVVGCIADCCSRLTENGATKKCELMSPFSDTIYKLSLRIAQAQDVNMRQNALYCMGALATCCNTESNMKHSSSILQCIKVYMQLPNNGNRAEKLVRDNAVSALGKLLISEPKSYPTKELLPIFLNALPLTCDFTENQYVYDVIIQFIIKQPSYIQPYIEQSIGLLGLALSDKDVPQITTNKIISTFNTICQDSNIQNIIKTKLPQKAQENIFKALNNNNQ